VDQETILRDEAESQLLREASKRRFLYRDVEELIENRFLTHSLVIEGTPITLRTLLPADYRRFRARVAHLQTERDVLRWSIAISVWMVDGYEVDPDDANSSYHIYKEWAQDLPDALVDVLAALVLGLQNRMSRAIRLTEAFCYEQYSRGLWRMLGPPSLDNANSVLRLWGAYNTSEDQDHAGELEWSRTRVIVGSMSNKAAKHITTELKKGEDRNRERKQRVIEEAVNWVIQGDEAERPPVIIVVGGKSVEVPKIHSAQTTADLEAEMNRVFAGEEDWHDYLVNQYQKGIKDQVLQKREERQRIIEEAQRRADEAEDQGHAPLVGYTRDQLDQLRSDMAKPKTTASLPASATSNHMFDRYINPTLRPGVLTPGLRVEDAGVNEIKAFGKPAMKEEGVGPTPTLQEKIAQRQPKLHEP